MPNVLLDRDAFVALMRGVAKQASSFPLRSIMMIYKEMQYVASSTDRLAANGPRANNAVDSV